MPSSLLLMQVLVMKKNVLRLCLVLIIMALLCAGIYGCYWFIRRDCLCYKARFYPSKQWPIDASLLEYATPQSGVMQIQTIECKHEEKVWLNITEESYWVQRFGK